MPSPQSILQSCLGHFDTYFVRNHRAGSSFASESNAHLDEPKRTVVCVARRGNAPPYPPARTATSFRREFVYSRDDFKPKPRIKVPTSIEFGQFDGGGVRHVL